MSSIIPHLKQILMKHTSILGLRVWISIIIVFFFVIVTFLAFFSIFIHFCYRRRKSDPTNINYLPKHQQHSHGIALDYEKHPYGLSSLDWRLLPHKLTHFKLHYSSDIESEISSLSCLNSLEGRKMFRLSELEAITGGFSDANVIGYEEFGVVYRGVLDEKIVAVKRVDLSRFGITQEDFIIQVEAILNVKHKNIVKLLGYCVEHSNRFLVYEYIDNSNLHEWLQERGRSRPLTWNERLKIINGIAKGLEYIHERIIGPNISHRHISSKNILLDHEFNPKISNIGIIKIFGPKISCIENNTQKNDVYSFGILIMEIISGKWSKDNLSESYLPSWFKAMIQYHQTNRILDPNIIYVPSSKEYKRVILIALLCTDIEDEERPKIGDVIRMLEIPDVLLNEESWRKTVSSCTEIEHEKRVSENSSHEYLDDSYDSLDEEDTRPR